MYYLTLLSGSQSGLRKKMSMDEPARLLIGQASQCDWVLDDDGVQSLHCLIETTRDDMTVIALLGEIAVNGDKVNHRNPVRLKPGDSISLGDNAVQMSVAVASENATQVKIQLKVQNPLQDNLISDSHADVHHVVKSTRRHSLQANRNTKQNRMPIRLPVFGAGLVLVGASCYALVGNNTFSEGQTFPQQLSGMVSASLPSSISEEIRPYIPAGLANTSESSMTESAESEQSPLRITLHEAFKQSNLTVPENSLGEASLVVLKRLDEVKPDPATGKDREILQATQNGKLIQPIVAFKVGEHPYLTDKTGAVYFLNARLPDGGLLMAIDKHTYTVENDKGRYRYSTGHLQVLKDPKEIIVAELELPKRPLHFRGKISSRYDHFILKASETYGVEAQLIKAVIQTESRFDPLAVSHVGAQGLIQIMPDTAKGLDLSDPFSPEHNIMAGSKLLGRLLKKYEQDLDLALAAYNAGEGAVRKYKGVPPYKETMEYVVKVNLALEQYRSLVNAANTVAEK